MLGVRGPTELKLGPWSFDQGGPEPAWTKACLAQSSWLRFREARTLGPRSAIRCLKALSELGHIYLSLTHEGSAPLHARSVGEHELQLVSGDRPLLRIVAYRPLPRDFQHATFWRLCPLCSAC